MGIVLRMPHYISLRVMPEGHVAEVLPFTGVRREYLDGHPWCEAARERESAAREASRMPASTSASEAAARQEKGSSRAKTPSR